MNLDGMGTAHYRRLPDDGLERHEGPVERCGLPECVWPRLGGMVTVTSRGRRVTGDLVSREGGTLVVKTADGALHRAPKVTAGVPDWGMYCPHGTKLIEAEPAEHICHLPDPPCDMTGDLGHLCIDHKGWCRACYPDGRKIRPWPCEKDGCSEGDFDREQQEMEEEYWEERRREAYGL